MNARHLGLLLVLLGCGCATTTPPPKPARTPSDRPPLAAVLLPLPVAQGQPQASGQEYFDPHGSGVPLFDTRGVEDQPLGRYFKVRDFAHADRQPLRYARIDGALVECLTRIQDATDDRMTILSSYRSFARNERLRQAGAGAAKSSYHISGKAADVVTSTPVDQFAVALFLECGCNVGFGVSPRFYHVDIRNYPVTPWGYGPAAAGRLMQGQRIQRDFCGAPG